MIFQRHDGQMMLSLHQPNSKNERMKLYPLQVTWEGFSRCDWDPLGPGPRRVPNGRGTEKGVE